MGRVNSSIQMEMCTKDTGKMTKQMDMECISMLMELNMMDYGKMTCNMDLELKLGLINPDMRESMLMVESKVLVVTSGVMVHSTLVNGTKTR